MTIDEAYARLDVLVPPRSDFYLGIALDRDQHGFGARIHALILPYNGVGTAKRYPTAAEALDALCIRVEKVLSITD